MKTFDQLPLRENDAKGLKWWLDHTDQLPPLHARALVALSGLMVATDQKLKRVDSQQSQERLELAALQNTCAATAFEVIYKREQPGGYSTLLDRLRTARAKKLPTTVTFKSLEAHVTHKAQGAVLRILEHIMKTYERKGPTSGSSRRASLRSVRR